MSLFRPARPTLAALLASALMVSGCSALGASSDDAPSAGPLEKATVKVATLELIDSAPLYLAMDQDYFAAEGLKVEVQTGTKGSVNIDNLIGRSVDFGLASYPPALIPQAKGAAQLKIVADAVQTTPNLIQVVIWDGGPVKTPRDLAGRKIGVSSKRGILELALTSQFTSMGIDARSIQFVSMEIASMPTFLKSGDIDAAVIAEPHLTGALKAGAVKLFDPFTGPTADFAWSGWFATEQFARDNPKTVAAFQRALARGVVDAADRRKVEQIVTKHIKVDGETAALMTLPVFPLTADPVRLQRVADLLLELKEIPARLDIRGMVLAPPAPPSSTTTSK